MKTVESAATLAVSRIQRRRTGGATTAALRGSSGVGTSLVRDGSRRLAWAGLTFGGAFTVQLLLAFVIFRHLHWFDASRTPERLVTGLGEIVLAAIVYTIARRARLTREQFVRIGLAYEVLGGLLIVLPDLRHVLVQTERGVIGATWLAVWIAAFSGLIPARPVQMVATGILTALMTPLVIAVQVLLGAPAPSLAAVVGVTVPSMMLAVFTAIPAIGLHRMAAAVAEARELGSYRLVERLGAGGMGEVWRAEHRMLSRPAAIKLIGSDALASDGMESAELIRRFELEAQATAALSSPHTVALYDFGVAEDGRLYYVMEMLHGLDLDRLVSDYGPLSPERTVHLLLQVCDSLDEAHAAGLVHRDIKPSNVHVGRLGRKWDAAKVLDFGLVKRRFGASVGEAQLTVATEIRGTPAFMAPEMVKGLTVDARTDLYAVGCLAYWMLTGGMVFEARTALEMIARHLDAAPAPPSEHTDRPVPIELDRIVLDCLAKNPAQRPSSARELARRLRAVPFADAWNAEKAESWWEVAAPEVVERAEAAMNPAPPVIGSPAASTPI